jgi:hypothetical protein
VPTEKNGTIPISVYNLLAQKAFKNKFNLLIAEKLAKLKSFNQDIQLLFVCVSEALHNFHENSHFSLFKPISGASN